MDDGRADGAAGGRAPVPGGAAAILLRIEDLKGGRRCHCRWRLGRISRVDGAAVHSTLAYCPPRLVVLARWLSLLTVSLLPPPQPSS